MSSIKIPVTINNKQALTDLLGELEIDDNEKCIVEYDASKNGETFIIKIGDSISGECAISTANAIDPETGEEFTLLKEYTYAFELNDGTKFEVKSTYLYSIGNIVSRMFYKVLSKAKAKYAPVRSSVSSETREKLADERARFQAAKNKKKAPKKTKEAKKANAEVESNEDF